MRGRKGRGTKRDRSLTITTRSLKFVPGAPLSFCYRRAYSLIVASRSHGVTSDGNGKSLDVSVSGCCLDAMAQWSEPWALDDGKEFDSLALSAVWS